MKKWLLALALLLVLQMVVVSASYAQAFSMARKIVTANELVLIPRVGAGGFTAQERADWVNDRLAAIVAKERLTRNNIWLRPVGNSVAIMIGRSLFYTVTPRDARANRTRSTMALARVWLRNARAAIPEMRPPAT